jgi:hypothetical protein
MTTVYRGVIGHSILMYKNLVKDDNYDACKNQNEVPPRNSEAVYIHAQLQHVVILRYQYLASD